MRRILATLAVVGALLFSAGAAWADRDEGIAAFERGDYAAALQALRPFAEQGNAWAQGAIGALYDNGMGVPQNYAEAVKWYRMAAEQGFAEAQYNFGVMYANGEGVPTNFVKAYMWISLAKAEGEKNASANLDIVKTLMTPAQIAKAQELADEWWEEHND